ncbi:hypothetical protein H5U35_10885 [Candidatus Aerophobetes bacterium]|nr:hypothetical protein [Candidatus Aerophobetes bacterium]
MGKKIPELMEEQREKFIRGAQERAKCQICGNFFFPQAMVDYVKKKGIEIEKVQEFLRLCPDCRREFLISKLNRAKTKTV